jgi:hypothetical protein
MPGSPQNSRPPTPFNIAGPNKIGGVGPAGPAGPQGAQGPAGSGTSPSLIQQSFTRIASGTTGTVTLTGAPVVGNLLIATASGFGGASGSVGLPGGFKTIFSDVNQTSAPNQGVVVGGRIVQAGDGTSWPGFGGGNGGDVFSIQEFQNAGKVECGNMSVTQATSLASFWGNSGNLDYTLYGLESDAINGFAGVTGSNLLFDGTGGGVNHPSVILHSTAGLPAPVTVTYTGTNFTTILPWYMKVMF